MLTTKDLPQGGNVPKTFNPGNITASITKIELAPGPSFVPNSYHVILHLEGPDMGSGFEGFYKDAISKQGERYKGQVGKVRMAQYAFADDVTKSGVPVNRDRSILRGLQNLAKVCGKEALLDQIEAPTIEDFVPLASELLSSEKPINWCIAGKEYKNKEGYTNHDLFLPATKGMGYAYEAVGTTNSKLLKFDPAVHIIPLKKAAEVDAFEVPATKDDAFEF